MNSSCFSSLHRVILKKGISSSTTNLKQSSRVLSTVAAASTLSLPRTGWESFTEDDVMPSSSNRVEYRSAFEGTLEKLLEVQSLGTNDTRNFQQVVKAYLQPASAIAERR
mmetsp:Transcript_25477/g.37634  ORF Transcript_25477/g.37634 Transcript_25477/m.37634 type:complete len:110 (-) Transcript_25477:200-529(-)|eukprot:CAMPEP_0194207918 /NCGR_PEP_ID=MMETSP0156-20130528/6535_1 /TAXON_ID=33649 /ORGANISM="Thalassionema nitzschioides, Strain L26-B" /LENGTH=109 /DNA_ID=CAMNT_0038934791 /DNA_START=25 /DNA_END=354 /DNA_ORIENTATION=-